ncbi:MAG: hypothetical protein C0518_15620 [Opitutus sp.]|nr:hypothetical protein [Opitutus sp.]
MIHLPRFTLWLFSGLLLLPWLVVLYVARPASVPALSTATTKEAGNGGMLEAKSGPWGKLTFERVLIEPPESLIAPPSASPAAPVWLFRGFTADELRAWWRSVGLEAAQLSQILAPDRWEISADTILIRPPESFITALSAEVRAKIYTQLGDFPENTDQAFPFRFRADIADEWFRDSELRPETVALVKRYLYRRGTSLIFSDLQVISSQLPTQTERVRLVKTLSRKSTLMVRLHLHPGVDLEALDQYWSRGQRARDIMPFIRSIVPKQGEATLDVIHLLPRLPRSLLYTYPLANQAGATSFLDCHWTTLNFFNTQPDPRFEEIDEVKHALLNEHFPVTGRPTFGDLIMLTRRDNSVVHSCIYIADTIVFTKNGASPNAPWILMELPDVIAFYPSDEPLDVQYYRSKRIAAEG